MEAVFSAHVQIVPAPPPPSLVYRWYRVPFPGVKLPGRGFNHANVKEKLEMYPYTLSAPFMVCFGVKFTCIYI